MQSFFLGRCTPYIDTILCNLCTTCVGKCPRNAIEMKNDRIEINYELCIRCGLCTRICPYGAIRCLELESVGADFIISSERATNTSSR